MSVISDALSKAASAETYDRQVVRDDSGQVDHGASASANLAHIKTLWRKATTADHINENIDKLVANPEIANNAILNHAYSRHAAFKDINEVTGAVVGTVVDLCHAGIHSVVAGIKKIGAK